MNRLCYEDNSILKEETVFIPVDFVTDADGLQDATQALYRLRKDEDRILYVETAYREFLHLKTTIHYPTRIGMINVERETRSFFTEFCAFHDHWRKRIAHHPRMDEYRALYEQLTHDAYDNSKEYAMATILRNYGTHSEDIIKRLYGVTMNYI